ncbi:hypothetical protein AAFC00_001847 [Neodothiora populina]|uniref:NEDD8-activating enzyme E1 regulatory subunit n=1 Tax=Neodothiora populina TaxID=2781224 RepID=A0ABR3PQC8_9PEZI
MATTAAADATPPPLHDVPNAKQKKYDRQLRLWAASGQQALEEAHILLINSGAGVTGIETLKNLILPGVGKYTILDSAVVSEEDLGVNFFLDESTLGGFRAEHTCRLLQELNPDVEGHFVTEPVESFIQKEQALQPYTLIIVTAPISSDVLASISTYSQKNHVPVFYTHCVGFYSRFSLSLPPAFPIVDTHPDPTATTDLRLLKPWPAIQEFAREKTANLSTLSEHDLGHVPYLLLLLHYVEEWKKSHDGVPPTSYKDKTDFRDMIKAAAPSPDEENYAEAAAAVLKSLNPPQPSSSLLETLNASESQSITSGSPSFWIIANAVYKFYESHNELPLPGAVPDMKAQSADYIRLQNIYKTRARQDAQEVLATVRALEKQLGRPAGQAIDEKEVEAFCKGAAHVKLVRGRPLFLPSGDNHTKRYNWSSEATSSAAMALMMASDSGILLSIAFLAWDLFVATHESLTPGTALKIPGAKTEDIESDEEKLRGIAQSLLDDLIKASGTFIEDHEYTKLKETLGNITTELVRAGGSELHNIASLTGGMVAQEVIKVITKQYVPVDNTCVFDGVFSKAAVLRL